MQPLHNHPFLRAYIFVISPNWCPDEDRKVDLNRFPTTATKHV